MAVLSIYRLLHLLRREADLVKMNVTAIDLERERFIQIRYNAWGPTTGRMGSLNGQRRLHKQFSKDSHLYGSKEDVWQYHLKIRKKEKKYLFQAETTKPLETGQNKSNWPKADRRHLRRFRIRIVIWWYIQKKSFTRTWAFGIYP